MEDKDIERSRSKKSSLPINKSYQFPKLHVLDGDGRSASRGRGQNLAVLLNVGDVSARGGIGSITGGLGVRKRDHAKVGKWNLTIALHVIFNDPLCVLTAKRSVGSQTLRHRLGLGQIFDRSSTGSRGGRVHSEFDNVSSRDSDV